MKDRTNKETTKYTSGHKHWSQFNHSECDQAVIVYPSRSLETPATEQKTIVN